MSKIFNLKTNNANPIKTSIEVLKHVIPNAPFVITKKKDNDNEFYGLEMASSDISNSLYVIFRLFGSKFDEYICKYDNYEIGINLTSFSEQLKAIDSNNLTLSILDKERQNLVLDFDNAKMGKNSATKIKIMELSPNPRKKHKNEFDVTIIMKSSEFHKVCRELSTIGDFVEITCFNKTLKFQSKNELASRSVDYVSTDLTDTDLINILNNEEKADEEKKDLEGINIRWKKNDANIVQGYYELKNITLFTKCSGLSTYIILNIKNGSILTITYNVMTYGLCMVTLAPVADEIIKNSNYNYEEDDIDVDDDIKDFNDLQNEDIIDDDSDDEGKKKSKKKSSKKDTSKTKDVSKTKDDKKKSKKSPK